MPPCSQSPPSLSHFTQKEWAIKNGFFVPTQTFEPSDSFDALCEHLEPLQKLFWTQQSSLYLRGSMLEEAYPHPLADLDLFLVGPAAPAKILAPRVKQNLATIFSRVDLVCLTHLDVASNPCFRLLLHTRSLIIAGNPLSFQPVPANWETAQAHWRQYRITEIPDRLICDGTSNVCMTKNLLRAIALLQLPNQRFSRDLATCTAWGIELSPPHVGECFLQAYHHIGKQQTPPLDIRPAKDWLRTQWTQVERW